MRENSSPIESTLPVAIEDGGPAPQSYSVAIGRYDLRTGPFCEVLPSYPLLSLMPRTKEPPETVALPEVPLREKHELGVSQEDDNGNDTLVTGNQVAKQTGDATTERKKDDDTSGSDSSPTDSSDEFDWDKEEDDASTKAHNDPTIKAKRGRAAYLAFMKLARPFRVTLLCILGGGILITPLLAVHFLFRSNPVSKHVFAWSVWFTIVWVAGCLTYVVVDAFGWVFLGLVSLCGGKTESLQMQLEVRLSLSLFICDAYWPP